MLKALEKIPKGVNIIIFIWAAVGLAVLLLREPKIRKEVYFYIFLSVTFFMVAWRILIGIETSRYAAGLILPFTVFAAYLLYQAGRRRHFLIRLALYVALACSGFILLKMNRDSVFRNYSSDIVSELFQDLDASRKDYRFRTPGKDFSRILFSSHLGSKVKVNTWEDEREPEVANRFVRNYNIVYPDTVYNVDSRSISGNTEVWDILRPKQIACVVENAKKGKKQLIFLLSSDNQCTPVSENRIEPYQPNLLDNGDLEVLDTPEESCEKLKTHFGNYAELHDATDPAAARTPRSAFFSTASESNPLPEVNVQNVFSIAGNHSARIRAAKDTAFLMFDKPFSNGEYEYSMLVKGDTGTSVAILCEVCKDDSRETRTIATFNIPDKRLFRITTRFSMEDLNGDDHFLAGVSVKKGEAYFDNFSLTRVTSDGKKDSDAD